MFIRIDLILFVATLFSACQQGGEVVQRNRVTSAAHSSLAALTEVDPAPSTSSNMVFQSVDGGQTWTDITSGLPRDFYPTSIYASEGEVFLGTSDGIYSNRTVRPMAPVWQKEHLLDIIQHEFIATILLSKEGAIARSIHGRFFQNLTRTGMWKPVYAEMAHKEANSVMTCANGVMLMTTNDGIYRCVYGAGQWGKVFTQGQVLSLVETNGVLLGAGEIGVVRSVDHGDHWTWVLTEDGQSRKTILIGDTVYAISIGGGTRQEVERDPMGTASRLQRTLDGGLTWQPLDEKRVLGQRIYDLQQSEDALLCATNLGVFRSVDGGLSWTLIKPNTSEEAIPSIAVDGPVIYAVNVFNGC